MKLYYLLLLIMFFLMSCERTTSNVSEVRHIGTSNAEHIFECTIDGHDYIKIGYGVAHSGTCKKCKQERDSIVNVLIKELSAN